MRISSGRPAGEVEALRRDVLQRLGEELVVAAVRAVDLVAGCSASTEPTAPPSWPMLECAGPCTRPAAASSSTYSSKVRISTSWWNIAVEQLGVGGVPVGVGRDSSVQVASGCRRAVFGHRAPPSSDRQAVHRIGSILKPFVCQEDLVRRHRYWIQRRVTWRCPDCGDSITSGSPCPTSTRRSGSSSTCSAVSTCTRSARSRDDGDWMAEHLNVHPRATVAGEPVLPPRRPGDPRGLPLHRAGPAARAARATATSAGTTSRSTSTTSDAAVAHLRAARRHGAGRADGEPRAARGPALGLLPGTMGHAVRAGLLSRTAAPFFNAEAAAG